jgi:hypothetical protein
MRTEVVLFVQVSCIGEAAPVDWSKSYKSMIVELFRTRAIGTPSGGANAVIQTEHATSKLFVLEEVSGNPVIVQSPVDVPLFDMSTYKEK